MLTQLRAHKRLQLLVGLLLGVAFGFLLQKGGVTSYDVVIAQLRFTDFTVVKVMLSAVLTGMIGVHALRSLGLARLQPKPGSFGATALGGLVFGIGFGLLGYCPGTVAGAVGQGWLDALLGGVVGMLLGAGLFAAAYPWLDGHILRKGDFGDVTWPRVFKVNAWLVVIPTAILIAGLLGWIETAGR